MNNLPALCALVRYYILLSTTAAQSGHATSSLSAVELMVGLMFGGSFHYDTEHPDFHNNDRLLFSKGHASPLFYALWATAGCLSEKDLRGLRTFDSPLEGHPSMRFPFTEAATGSLGQGLSVGVGMALNAKQEGLSYRTYVLLGDSEIAEGQIWEAVQLAVHYKLDNLVGIIDVNRLGQRGETMYGHDVEHIANLFDSFGWETVVIDGHDLGHVQKALGIAHSTHRRPTMIIAKTVKGKGISEWENQNGWHSKTLSPEQLKEVLKKMGPIDKKLQGVIPTPSYSSEPSKHAQHTDPAFHVTEYDREEKIATKKAFGNALEKLGTVFPELVVLDAEVSNSTHTDQFQKKFPSRFYEMFIAEQNMVSVATGFSKMGKHPCVSTFAAFLSRTNDQLRMAAYSRSTMLVAGSYAGVSIGKDGFSQMGLEDLAFMRALFGSTVLYPADATAAEKLTELSLTQSGITYLRLTREPTGHMYSAEEKFEIGGSNTLHSSPEDVATVVCAGITVHEALKAYRQLKKEKIAVRVIDLYSIKPIDYVTLRQAARETKHLVVVEDHYPEGGIGEAVLSALAGQPMSFHHLAVHKMPRSGEPKELLEYEEISAGAIVEKIKEITSA